MQIKPYIKPSDRLEKLPKYIFTELMEWVETAKKEGLPLIDLSIGNPDGPTPQPVIEAAKKSMDNIVNQGYTDFRGKIEFRQAVADWMKKKYNVDINAKTEVLALSGAKEGLAHLAMAYTNPDDLNIVPDPYYPVHSRGTWLSSGNVHHVPLKKENDFLPDLKSIPEDVAKKAKVFFINFPNNPTTSVATLEFFEELVTFCRENNIIICSDMAYGCISYDGYKPPSIFQIEGAKDLAIEVHTFSKTYNMAGWRVGFAVGNDEIIQNLFRMKSNVDYGTAAIIQDAAAAALKLPQEVIDKNNDKYRRRRDMIVEAFNSLGWDIEKPKATMFVWLPLPVGYSSKEWCLNILQETGILFTPGMAFGDSSNEFFRVSLCVADEKIKEAFERLKKAGVRYNCNN